MNRFFFVAISCFLLLVAACKDDCPSPPTDCILSSESLVDIPFEPTPKALDIPIHAPAFPPVQIPQDNPMTEEGVELGRRLFYDPILSADSSKSCFSCHLQEFSFADQEATSEGIDNIRGVRSSMSLVNMAWNNKGFFWDGRSPSLEHQAGLPVIDSVELHDTWENVICKLNKHDTYPQLFREAFGIERKDEISRDLATKALAQFERTLISGNSKFDRNVRGEVNLTDQELIGRDMFFDTAQDKISFPDAECGHCHGGPLLTSNEFRNNGIENAPSFEDYPDKGRGAITGFQDDNGFFRVPTLRNIELTAPYMHDGRFETLEEVVEHYASGGHQSAGQDVLIYPLVHDSIQKAAIVAFLKTFTDPNFLTNPDFQNPF